MTNLEFPTKKEADDLTLNELMQAIAMAGLWVEMYGGNYMWRFKLSPIAGFVVPYVWGEHKDSPRAALDDACEQWRKESSDE